MKQGWFIWLFLLFIWACEMKEEHAFQHTIAVEGWIEEGDVPYVILTQTVPFFSVLDSVAMEDMVIRWAKVSVSDGEHSEILAGRIDKNYFPPFIYRGIQLVGEAGKTYTLKVEYSGRTWEATTTIPPSVKLDTLIAKRLPDSDTLKNIEATFHDPVGEKNYYRLHTRIWNKDSRYIGSLMGNLDDNLFDGQEMKTSVFQGLNLIQKQNFNPYFHISDTVLIKFTTTTEFGFRYWTAYENEIINSQNPFLPAVKNLPSNIPGGKGIWCGYGKQEYIILPDTLNTHTQKNPPTQ